MVFRHAKGGRRVSPGNHTVLRDGRISFVTICYRHNTVAICVIGEQPQRHIPVVTVCFCNNPIAVTINIQVGGFVISIIAIETTLYSIGVIIRGGWFVVMEVVVVTFIDGEESITIGIVGPGVRKWV